MATVSTKVSSEELIDKLSTELDITKSLAKDIMVKYCSILKGYLSTGWTVPLHGLGLLKVSQKPARVAKNPKTGETVKVPKRKAIRFSVSTAFKKDLLR